MFYKENTKIVLFDSMLYISDLDWIFMIIDLENSLIYLHLDIYEVFLEDLKYSGIEFDIFPFDVIEVPLNEGITIVDKSSFQIANGIISISEYPKYMRIEPKNGKIIHTNMKGVKSKNYKTIQI